MLCDNLFHTVVNRWHYYIPQLNSRILSHQFAPFFVFLDFPTNCLWVYLLSMQVLGPVRIEPKTFFVSWYFMLKSALNFNLKFPQFPSIRKYIALLCSDVTMRHSTNQVKSELKNKYISGYSAIRHNWHWQLCGELSKGNREKQH